MTTARTSTLRMMWTMVLAACVALGAVACSDGDAESEAESATGDFCTEMEALGAAGADPVTNGEKLRELAATAPADLREPLDELGNAWDRLSGAESGEGDVLAVMDEVSEASEAVGDYLADECGVESSDPIGGEVPLGPEAPSENDLELTDEEVQAAVDASGAPWASRINRALAANGGAIVQLAEEGTEDDALAACSDLVEPLEVMVTVVTASGATIVSDDDGSCRVR